MKISLEVLVPFILLTILSSEAYVEARQIKGEEFSQDEKEIKRDFSTLDENKGKNFLNPSSTYFLASSKKSNGMISNVNSKNNIDHMGNVDAVVHTQDVSSESHHEITPEIFQRMSKNLGPAANSYINGDSHVSTEEISTETHHDITPEMFHKILSNLPKNRPMISTQEISTESHHEITPEIFYRMSRNLPRNP